MKSEFYLVVNANGGVRVVKTRPSLGWSEISIKCNLDLPDSIFRRPAIQATIAIKDKDVPLKDITAEMQNNIQQALQEATGIEVRLTIEQPQQ